MPKKLNCRVKIESLSYLKVIVFGFLFSILLANCNGGKKVPSPDPAEEINWLKEWGALEFAADPNNPVEIEKEQDRIRWYARGYLVEYNEKNKTNHIFEKFEFIKTGDSPLKYSVNALLNPPAVKARHVEEDDELGGAHLIPPPPPPPGKGG